ncbi:MAG: hypothetical protein JKP92_00040 [Alphaproteobacteria bacterium]|nr:hypothetical protein [Alphaproteobacteria bacterium]
MGGAPQGAGNETRRDLTGNALRGILAEYIVGLATRAHHTTRTEWEAYDLETPQGVKIEVKSAAYVQSWAQKGPSRIAFSIKPSRAWDAQSGAYAQAQRRQADVYVFCLLHHRERESIDPLNMDQWTFYVMSAADLDAGLGTQKSLSLARLCALGAQEVPFEELDKAIARVAHAAPVVI